MAGPVPPYLTTQTAAQTAFTVPFGLLAFVNAAIAAATAAGEFNTTVDCSLFVTEDVSNLRIYLDSLGYLVEFAKGMSEKSLLIDWGRPLDIDGGGGGGSTTVTQGTTPWIVAIDQTGDNNDVDVINGTGAAAVNIQDGGNSITVDGTIAVSNFPATQPISGTVAATQSGEWDVNIEDTAGNALTSIGGALDVNLKSTGVTQPISGTVTANIGTTGGLALDATLTNATQKTKIVDAAGTNVVTVDATGDLQVDVNNFPATQTISGTVTANQGTSPWIVGIDQTGDNNDVDVINGAGAAAVNIQDGGNSITVDGTISTSTATSGTATLSNVSGSASSVTLLSANASRKQAMIYNDSSSKLLVKFGTTASATSFTVQLVSQAYYELPTPVYTGRIDGIWNNATGAARITELT